MFSLQAAALSLLRAADEIKNEARLSIRNLREAAHYRKSLLILSEGVDARTYSDNSILNYVRTGLGTD